MGSDLERTVNHFKLQLRKRGRFLSLKQLKDYARSNKLEVSTRDLEDLRSRVGSTARFRRAPKKPKRFSSFHRPTLDIIQSDLFFMNKRHRRFNENAIGGLIAIQPLTGLLFLYPIKNKSANQLEKAFDEMLYNGPFSKLTQIQTDMESALTSTKFANRIRDVFGVKLVYLKKGVQAWAAERAIAQLKTRASSVLEARGDKFHWLEAMRSVVESVNKEVVPGTTFKRNAVNPNNALKFISQKAKVKDASLLFNIGRSSARPGSILHKVVRFKIGDKVLLTREADPTVKRKDIEYGKKSIQGYYSDRLFVIKEAILSLNAVSPKKVFVQSYRLATLERPDITLDGVFYVEELAPALYADSSTDSE